MKILPDLTDKVSVTNTKYFNVKCIWMHPFHTSRSEIRTFITQQLLKCCYLECVLQWIHLMFSWYLRKPKIDKKLVDFFSTIWFKDKSYAIEIIVQIYSMIRGIQFFPSVFRVHIFLLFMYIALFSFKCYYIYTNISFHFDFQLVKKYS